MDGGDARGSFMQSGGNLTSCIYGMPKRKSCNTDGINDNKKIKKYLKTIEKDLQGGVNFLNNAS